MKSTDLDNRINRINKKVQRIRDTLTSRSSLFGRAASIINGNMSTAGLSKLVEYKNDYRIKRGKTIKSLKPEQMMKLSEALDQIEMQLDRRSLTAEKQRLRDLVYKMRGKRGGRVTLAEYRAAERLQKERAELFERALDYFYNYVENDPNAPERVEMLKIKNIKGRRKTHEEINTFIQLAHQHMMRTTKKDPKQRSYRERVYNLTHNRLVSLLVPVSDNKN